MTLAVMNFACDEGLYDERTEVSAEVDSEDDLALADADEMQEEAVIAEFRAGTSTGVRFVDERVSFPEGGVGMLVYGTPQLLIESEQHGLTPLEVYMALSGDSHESAPERLLEDHLERVRLQDRATAIPRRLGMQGGALVPVASDLSAGPVKPVLLQETDTYDCTAGTAWLLIPWYDWMWDKGSPTDIDFLTETTGNQDVVTAGSAERWLGICVETGTVSWLVQVQISAGLWGDVAGTSTSVSADNWVHYYSTSIGVQVYRAHITNAAGDQYAWVRAV
ncbi:hypothetical protein [Nannocystis punicea]|uniref:Uncharacterized protein n=1 Tax=Nannocystis punicea TaxID=2995304 RepID=A0ABY7H431_9BACT|nr:hypothetical protein [Nannocystis poenicansa]WAS93744.1 hypothetical protein O0S08_47025 [Nannocystis poenicansa]